MYGAAALMLRAAIVSFYFTRKRDRHELLGR